jgi:hypothetical protein
MDSKWPLASVALLASAQHVLYGSQLSYSGVFFGAAAVKTFDGKLQHMWLACGYYCAGLAVVSEYVRGGLALAFVAHATLAPMIAV